MLGWKMLGAIAAIAIWEAGALVAGDLRFSVDVGDEENRFVQGDRGAFHVALSRDPSSRLVIASPAGNAGAALWFEGGHPAMVDGPRIAGPETVELVLRLPVPLVARRALTGSVRTIRDVIHGARRDPGLLEALEGRLGGSADLVRRLRRWIALEWTLDGGGRSARLSLEGLDGRHRYELVLAPETGEVERGEKAEADGPSSLRLPAGLLRVRYRSDHAPLTPFAPEELLSPAFRRRLEAVGGVERERIEGLLRGLRFLAYREKLLAGSWRYLTYFGRDGLISMRLLAPALSVEALEAGLRAVSERMSAEGEVAHEEALACQGAIDRIRLWLASAGEGEPRDLDRPALDRKMVDDDFLVLPLLRDYRRLGGRRLFRLSDDGCRPLLANADRVLSLAASGRMLRLPAGQSVGDWRDSNEGLGWGRVPFSVNGAHVPAALVALQELLDDEAWPRDELVETARRLGLKRLASAALRKEGLAGLVAHWESRWRSFRVRLDEGERRRRLDLHRRDLGFSPVEGRPPYAEGFLALSRGERGRAVPVLHGDTAFMLLDLPLGDEEALSLCCEPFETAFPDGLRSAAGFLTALPALAAKADERRLFDRHHYHGSVVWDWPQVLLHVALMRRLDRWPVPAPRVEEAGSARRARLARLLAAVEETRRSVRSWGGSELWTWRLDGGRPVPARFGGSAEAVTESNALQLWSVAALAVDVLGRP